MNTSQSVLVDHVKRSFLLTTDLVQELSEEFLALKLQNLPSNTIGQQLWCMIGARESYLNAVKNNGWSGFSCSLKTTVSKVEILSSLNSSQENFLKFLNENELNNVQFDLLLCLLEHEIQHHGQLIRFVYANKLQFPASWNRRYTV